jgi:hypothetical protein
MKVVYWFRGNVEGSSWVSDREIFALFYFPKGLRKEFKESLEGLKSLSHQAGVSKIGVHAWGKGVVTGTWGGIGCRSHLLLLSDSDVLVLNLSEDKFRTMREDSGELLPEDGALSVAYSFRDACIAMQPLAAFMSTYPYPMDFEVAEHQERNALAHDLSVLVRERFGLLYVPPERLEALHEEEWLAGRDMVAAGDGLLVFEGIGKDRW